MRANKQTAFTLIELMIVVALLAIVVSVALPSFGQMISSNRLQAETSEIESFLRYARSQALVSRHSYTVEMNDDTWKVMRGTNQAGVVEREYRVPAFISINKEFESDIVFNPNGTSATKNLYLCPLSRGDKLNKLYHIRVTSSGMIEIKVLDANQSDQGVKCV